MDKQLDQFLQEMSIEDEDDKPMVKWILEMPRIWRLYDRVKGIALSHERFQFIFKYEEDLQEVLKNGVWTQDDWGVVMEKWVEDPPPDYLQFLLVWIRLRNIPVNHYTRDTIKKIAGCVGRVVEFPFDEDEAQSKDYVCVRILLDLSKGLKNFKELELPNGSLVKISIDYERIHKRCFQCQRLTHDKSRCPFVQPIIDDLNSEDYSKLSSGLDKGKELEVSGL